MMRRGRLGFRQRERRGRWGYGPVEVPPEIQTSGRHEGSCDHNRPRRRELDAGEVGVARWVNTHTKLVPLLPRRPGMTFVAGWAVKNQISVYRLLLQSSVILQWWNRRSGSRIVKEWLHEHVTRVHFRQIVNCTLQIKVKVILERFVFGKQSAMQ